MGDKERAGGGEAEEWCAPPTLRLEPEGSSMGSGVQVGPAGPWCAGGRGLEVLEGQVAGCTEK